MVGSKQPTAVWLSPEEADRHCRAGASVWPFASTDKGVNPDVVICGIGAEMTFEVVAAAAILRRLAPELKVRVVNVTDLMVLGAVGSHPHAMTNEDFNALFTEDKAVHFNYHGSSFKFVIDIGYRTELQGLLFHRPNLDRVSIEGYNEEGTTTTPFSMMLLNHTSRFDVALAAVRGAAHNHQIQVRRQELITSLNHAIKKANVYSL
jgi:xylulose-5-phosphate/fructose-6-phosphate phosphoketolase